MPAEKIETQRDTHFSSADICRRNGWTAGTLLRAQLAGDEFDYVKLTAIGEGHILAIDIDEVGRPKTGLEYILDLGHRHWEVFAV